MNIPVLVGFCFTEQDALDTLANGLDVSGQIVLQKTDYNQPKYIDYIDSPVFLLGKYVDIDGSNQNNLVPDGAILTNTGKYWIPNGTLFVFSDSITYDVVILKDGYTIGTWFNQDNDNVERYLRWNDKNKIFIEVTKNGQ